MKTWLTRLPDLAALPGPLHLAIGVFDGIHRGHQTVLASAVQNARTEGGSSVLVTFSPHPAALFSPRGAPPRITQIAYQQVLAAELGVDHLLALPFDRQTAATPAADFASALAGACRPLASVSVGEDWTFGRNREGTLATLREAGQRHRFTVHGLPRLCEDERVISSTILRRLIATGDLDAAARLLGRRPGYLGVVGRGRQLGRQLGFPTANLGLEVDVLPPPGVHACLARINAAGPWLPAVANLGLRPTVEQGAPAPSLEVHLLDWNGDLYDHHLEVRLHHHLRPEKKFPNLDALRHQIAEDIHKARLALQASPCPNAMLPRAPAVGAPGAGTPCAPFGGSL
jgi:riboflavin kinase/FMN adenylyltransferase